MSTWLFSTVSCSLKNLARLVVRDNLPHSGWTEEEAHKLQVHIEGVWLSSMKAMQRVISKNGNGDALRVLKTHMIVAHATERLTSHGGVEVLTQLRTLRQPLLL